MSRFSMESTVDRPPAPLRPPSPEERPSHGGRSAAAALAALPEAERDARLEALLGAAAEEALGLAPGSLASADRRRPLAALGLDSLAAVTLAGAIEESLGIEVPLDGLLAGASLGELTAAVQAALLVAAPGAPGAPRPAAAPPGGGVVADAPEEAGATTRAAPAAPGAMAGKVAQAAMAAAAAVAADAAQEAAGAAGRVAAEAGADGGEPLSAGQQALWFLERLAPAAGAYNVVVAARVRGLDAAFLRPALELLAARHPALRSRFVEGAGGPVRRPLPAAQEAVDFAVADVAGRDEAGLRRHLRHLESVAWRPFDLEHGPLLRARLLTAPGESVLLLAVHHLVADFWSLGILARELAALRRGGPAAAPALPPAAARYGDFVRWQRERLAGPAGRRLWAFWQETLAGRRGPVPDLELPTDRPRQPLQGWRGVAGVRRLPPVAAAGLRSLAAGAGATLFVALAAAWQALLGRHSGQEDFAVATPTSGRRDRRWDGVVGYFVNPVALRADLAGDPSFRDLMAAGRREVAAALEHAELPFAWVAERLRPGRDAGRPPLCQTLIALEPRRPGDPPGLAAFALGEDGARLALAGGIELTAVGLAERRAQFELTLGVAELEDGGLALLVEAAADLFDAATAARMAAQVETLLAAAVAAPDAPVWELPLLGAAERRELLSDRPAPAAPAALLPELIAARARRTPGATAVIAGEVSWTYEELAARAAGVAARLRPLLAAGTERPVALLVERSPELVTGAFGILTAGAVYLPLDPEHALPRLAWTLADAGAAALLTERRLAARLPAVEVPVVLLDASEIGDAGPAGSVDGAAAPAPAPGEAAPLPGQLAYLVYTSGSTGRPKAVAVSHAAAAADCLAWAEVHALGAGDRVLQLQSAGFDAAVEQIFATLAAGATVVLRGPEVWGPRELAAETARRRLTVLDLPTAFFARWVEDAADLPAPPPSLRLIVVSGEELGGETVRRFRRSPLAAVPLVNCYGPTEAVVSATVHRVAREEGAADLAVAVPAEAESLATMASLAPITAITPVAPPPAAAAPLGRPLPGRVARVLDRRGLPQPHGMAGELCLGGLLARGYLGRADLTAERFVPDAWGAPGERLYRTGDLARRGGDGNLEYLGRLDQQVKIRGFRVEPGEVEAELLRHPAVREAAVLAVPAMPARPAGAPVGPWAPPGAARPGAAGAAVAGAAPQLAPGGVWALPETARPWAAGSAPTDAPPHLAASAAPGAPGGSRGGELRLVAFVAPAVPAGLPEALAVRLPGYMVPAAWRALPALPLNASGKIDRRALRQLAAGAGAGAVAGAAGSGGGSAAPGAEAAAWTGAGASRGAVEELLAGIWAELLDRPRVGRDEDFFALGGHSLLATRLVSQVWRRLGVELPVSAVFIAPTVAALAQKIAALAQNGQTAEAAAAPPIERLARRAGEPLPLSFAQRRLWFLDRLTPGTAAYNMPGGIELTGPLSAPALAAALAAVLARHQGLRVVYAAPEGEPVGLLEAGAAGVDQRQRQPGRRPVVQAVGAGQQAAQRRRGRAGGIPPVEIEQRLGQGHRQPGAGGLPQVDLAALPAAAREREAARLGGEEARRPFDLGRGPLLRRLLLRLDPPGGSPPRRGPGPGGPARELDRRRERHQERHRLLLTFHHIAADGWSLGLFLDELTALYAAAVLREPALLPALPVQYADFAVWQERWLAAGALDRQLAYWRERLSGLPVVDLPADRPRPALRDGRGAVRARLLPAVAEAALAGLARRQGVTRFMAVLGVVQTLLGRLTGEDVAAVGSPVANRRRPEVEHLIGLFVNTLVLDVRLGDDPAVGDLLERVRGACLGAYAHQDLPFERLVEELQPDRDLARNPLFQVLFVLADPLPARAVTALAGAAAGAAGAAGQGRGPLRLTPWTAASGTAKLDLSLTLAPLDGGGWELAAEYATALWDPASIDRLLVHLDVLLAAAAALPPATRLSALSLLSAGERHQLIEEWNAATGPAAAPAGEPALLHGLVAAQCARTPDAVAVAAALTAERLTYGELSVRADRLARRLRGLGIGAEQRVGVCLARRPGLIPALLGVLRAGAAYLPLDPALPDTRLEAMLEEGGAAALVTEPALAGRLAGFGGPVVLLDGGGPLQASGSGRAVAPDAPFAMAAADGAGPAAAPEGSGSVATPAAPAAAPGEDGPGGGTGGAGVGDRSLAYAIFTSGSTGRPKAVGIEHRGAAALVRWAVGAFEAGELAGVLAATSVGFDLSVFEIFVPLAAGGRVILAPSIAELPAVSRGPAAGEVTLVNTVPSALAELLGGALPPALRTVNLAGEALPPDLVARLYDRPPMARVNNLYGPSEDTTYSTGGPVSPGAVTIGRPLAGRLARVLGRRGELLPAGVPGELAVGGAGLARGYLGRPELTAERFVPDPAGAAGARLYRTGDRARLLSDGHLDYLGRLDHQVKLRGVRIELGEIESHLARHPAVRQAVVALRQDGPAGPRLAAYLVLAEGAAPGVRTGPRGTAEAVPVEAGLAAELAAQLARQLPAVMVPSAWVRLAALPLSPNGKVDRRALPAPPQVRGADATGAARRPGPLSAAGAAGRDTAAPGSGEAEAEDAAARNPVEERLAAIWREVLGAGRVGIHDNFFALGGHSLLALRAAFRIGRELGVEPPVAVLFQHPTVAALAAWLAGARAAAPPETPAGAGAGAKAGAEEAPAAATLALAAVAAVAEASGAATAAAARPAAGDSFPLSPSQQRLWFLERLRPGRAGYNLGMGVRLTGGLDTAPLAGALRQVIRRHEPLRTAYGEADGVPFQMVLPAPSRPLAQADLRGLPPACRQDELRRAARRLTERPFDLPARPPVRFLLVTLAPGEQALLCAFHHLAVDGWSLEILGAELAALLGAHLGGGAARLPARSWRYADFVAWQRAALAGEALAPQLGYWRRQLAGVPRLELPADRPRPAGPSGGGTAAGFELPPALAADLARLARDGGGTLFMALLAGFLTLLARYSGADDLAVGVPVAGRGRAETEPLIGLFTNTLVIRAGLPQAVSFRALLRQVRSTAAAAQAHQEVPFERLVEELQPDRAAAASPLFQVMFAFLGGAAAAAELPGLRLELMENEAAAAQFELTCAVQERGGRVRGWFEAATALFDAATAARMRDHYLALLRGAAAAPDGRLLELPLLAAVESHQLLLEWNDRPLADGELPAAWGAGAAAVQLEPAAPARGLAVPAAGYIVATPARSAVTASSGPGSAPAPVHAGWTTLHWLDQVAAAAPDRIALLAGRACRALHARDAPCHGGAAGLSLSYGTLHALSVLLARRLAALGVVAEDRVGLLLDRSPDAVTAMLGVWRAGAAWVPLDPVLPEARLAAMAADAGVALVIAAPGRRPAWVPAAVPILDLDAETLLREAAAAEGLVPGPMPAPGDLAYMLFTSGTTGRPKAVGIEHGSLLLTLRGWQAQFPYDASDRMPHLAPLPFDTTLIELFLPLLAGGQVELLTAAEILDFPRLAATLALSTQAIQVPSLWRRFVAFLREDAAAGLPPSGPGVAAMGTASAATAGATAPGAAGASGTVAFASLRRVYAGGERVPADLLRDLQEVFPRAEIAQTYGPTETAITCAVLAVPRPPHGTIDERSLLGRPLPGAVLTVLDRWGNPAPIGVPGELMVGGGGVGRGYRGRPELTADRFRPAGNGRVYRTGDLTRLLPDGRIEFLGRTDHQIKLRGMRIEPGEIEAALRAAPGVRDAAVVAVPPAAAAGSTPAPGDGQGAAGAEAAGGGAADLRLAAYVVPADAEALAGAGAERLARTLRQALAARLPEHMVPSAWVTLAALPLSPNGKVDRRALPPPPAESWRLASAADSTGRGAEEAAGGAAPAPFRTPEEELLGALWQEVLGVPRVSRRDSFFDLGGHSLLVTQLASRVRRAFGVEVPLADLFGARTLAEQALRVTAAVRRRLQLTAGEEPEAPLPPLLPRREPGPAPLSFAQERLWFLDRLEPGPAYNMPAAARLRGPLAPAALAAALAAVVGRHEALRTCFLEERGRPVQLPRAWPEAAVDGRPAAALLPVIDLAGLPGGRREAAARQLAAAEAVQPFDLAAGRLLRAALLRLAPGEHWLLLTLHHIAADGWSMGILLEELGILYAAGVLEAQGGRRGQEDQEVQGGGGALPPRLAALPVQYADFAVWQRGWLSGERLDRVLGHWRGRLAGAEEAVELPADRARPATATGPGPGGHAACEVAAGTVDRLAALARRRGWTPFMPLLAAFAALLGRWSGRRDSRDVVVGSPIASRNRVEIERLIGFFANTLALRLDLDGDPAFGDLADRARAVCLDAYAHQDLPFEKLVEELAPERRLGQTPLFQVMLVLQDTPPRLTLPDLAADLLDVGTSTAKFDLVLVLVPPAADAAPPDVAGGPQGPDGTDGLGPSAREGHRRRRGLRSLHGLRCEVEFALDLFDAVTIDRMMGHFRTLLDGAVADPGARLSELPLLTAGERVQLARFGAAPEPWPAAASAAGPHAETSAAPRADDGTRLVHRRVALRAALVPDAVAVTGGGASLTYGELLRRARALARELRLLGVGADVTVGIGAGRSLDAMVSLLAILEAGGAYLPLDPAHPPDLRRRMLADAGARLVVTGAGQAAEPADASVEVLVAGAGAPPPPRRPAPAADGARPPEVTRVPETAASPGLPGAFGRPAPAAPESLVYVTYTSGSTGLPKGIAMPHEAISAMLDWQLRTSDTGAGRTLQFTALSFDVSCQEIFATWSAGGTLVLVDDDLRRDPAALLRLLAEEQVERLFVPFVVLQQLAAAAAPALPALPGVPPLREVMSAGEQLHVTPQVAALFARLRGARLQNHYGPSETHVATWLELAGDAAAWPERPAVGVPAAHVRVVLADRHGGRVPVGVAGEVLVGGPGLARGYLGRPELTAELFLPDPFADVAGWEPGSRLYRTGDLARLLPGGTIEYLGRADLQLKVRGQRIEPAEVEAVLARHPAVQQVVVAARGETAAERRLAAFVVPRLPAEPTAAELRAFAAAALPPAMVPGIWVRLDRLPLTGSGKLDRRALDRIDLAAPGGAVRVLGEGDGLTAASGAPGTHPAAPAGTRSRRAGGPPLDPVQELLAGVWREVLGVREVTARDTFFTLGGHSLLATQLISRIRDTFGVELPVRQVFTAPSLAAMAAAVTALVAARGGPPSTEAAVATTGATGAEPATPPPFPPLPPFPPVPKGATGQELPPAPPPPLRRVPRDGPLPLSFAQERLWFLDRLQPGSPAYNIPLVLRLAGWLDPRRLEGALGALARRQEVLRTVFAAAPEGPVQVVLPAGRVPVPVADLRRLPAPAREAAARRLAAAAAAEPFDLARGPLLRALLLRLEDAAGVLFLGLHHIAADGWSLGVLVHDLRALYAGAALSELPVQYGDFAAWQRRWLTGEVLARQLAWWRQRLAGAPEALELPADHPRPAVQSWRGGERRWTLDAGPGAAGVAGSGDGGGVTGRGGPGAAGASAATTGAVGAAGAPEVQAAVRRLSEVCARHGATLFMALAAALAALLGRLAGQRELTLGAPIANRNRSETEGLIGFFVNTLVLRLALPPGASFGALLREVREVSLDAYAHQDVPFEKLVDELRPQRDLSRSPLFQAAVVLQNAPLPEAELDGVRLSAEEEVGGAAKFDLSWVFAEERDGSVAGWLQYAADLFEPTTAARWVGHFTTLLAGLAADPEAPHDLLPLLTAGERHQVVREWNDSPLAGAAAVPGLAAADAAGGDLAADGGLLVPAAIAGHARRSPDALALAEGGLHLSRGELMARTLRLAGLLLHLGAGRGRPVALWMERSAGQVAAALAVLQAGAAYVSLDPSWPAGRVEGILAECGAPVLMTDASRLAAARAMRWRRGPEPSHAVCVELGAAAGLMAAGAATEAAPALPAPRPAAATPSLGDPATGTPLAPPVPHRWSGAGRGSAALPAAPGPAPVLAEDLAYVIYTSGSTGYPKGVELTHRGLANLARWYREAYAAGERDRASYMASPGFDASILEIWPHLAAGVSLHLPGLETRLVPARLLAWLAERAITLSWLSTAVAEQVVELAERQVPPGLALRWLETGGDRLRRPPRAPLPFRFTDQYGPSEASVLASAQALAAPAPGEPEPAPSVGRPMASAHVADARHQTVPPGVAGELLLGGPGLARGYLGRPALTAERFIPDSLSGRRGERLYRTGDLARRLPDGTLQFLGRVDHQVKIRGQRIELGEVEAALGRHPAIAEAVVAARGDAAAARLVGYLVPVAGAAPPAAAELRAFLARTLPEAMIPGAFVALGSLPLTSRDKIDRAALPAPDEAGAAPAGGEAWVAPRNDLERAVAGIWRDVLGVERIGAEESFFTVGGNSLHLARLQGRLRDELGRDVPLLELFRHPTIAGLARRLAAEEPAAGAGGGAAGNGGASGAVALAPPAAKETETAALPAAAASVPAAGRRARARVEMRREAMQHLPRHPRAAQAVNRESTGNER